MTKTNHHTVDDSTPDRGKVATDAGASGPAVEPAEAKPVRRRRPARHRLRLRHLRPEDYDDLQAMMAAIYTGIKGKFGGALAKGKYLSMLNRFPEGQICIEDRGRVIAVALSLVVDYSRFGDRHTYAQITGDAYFTTHDPDGDVLYGADVFVHPDYRDLRLGRRLYDARKELCRRLNLKAIIAGGRIPGYKEYAEKMRPHEYIELVDRKKLRDPILSFQLANEFQVRRIIKDYMPGDSESLGYATLLQWENIYYDASESPLIGGKKKTARIGAVQWQLRAVHSLEELVHQVEFFVDAVAGYKGDFVLLPEFFNIALMGLVEQDNAAQAMRRVAAYTPQLADAMGKMAVSHNINIIGGSMPVLEDEQLYNVAFLFRRDGTRETQYKLHITPIEKRLWTLEGGNQLRTFRTDAGTIGILICYDCEFPELGRILADKGMEILFVPFWTETKNGYQRVRHCAQARAIENECYVVVSGSVGNLPRVENVNVHYAQSAIFSPSDFPFPHDTIVAESNPNTETVLIADVDLDKLQVLRDEGSVRNFRDRRLDLYKVEWQG